MSNEHSDSHLQDAWQSQHVPPFHMSLDEIRKRTKKFDKEMRIRNVSFNVFCVLLIALTGLWFVQFPNLVQRIGCILTALGAVFIIYQIRLKQVQKGSAEAAAARMGHVASVELYRMDLQRELEFYCGIWLWSRMLIFAPGLLLIMVGPRIAQPNKTAIYWIIFWAVSVVVGVCVNNWMSRRLRREISELGTFEMDQS